MMLLYFICLLAGGSNLFLFIAPLCGHTTLGLSIHHLMDIWVVLPQCSYEQGCYAWISKFIFPILQLYSFHQHILIYHICSIYSVKFLFFTFTNDKNLNLRISVNFYSKYLEQLLVGTQNVSWMKKVWSHVEYIFLFLGKMCISNCHIFSCFYFFIIYSSIL